MSSTTAAAGARERPAPPRPDDALDALVALCLERFSAGGSAALDELCAAHPGQAGELRARIERLAALGLAGESRPGQPRAIGPFRVLGTLGQGGMGRVYLGQQSAPVRRLAAVKVMRPGPNAGRLVARFEAERQALAVLSHPAIAQVLEAGTTEDGEPWFAMEYVDGRPLTEAADEARLDLRERIELLAQVCDAVTHAHQNGILHRDLKPNNVLVTERPGHRQVKVIDFGLAKALDAAAGPLPMLTESGQLVGTPTHMSPEQAGVNGRPVDLRADVYALGVLLYELLTGRLPLRPEGAENPAMEMLRLLREVEPVPPSRRVLDQPEEAARRRRIEPRRWARALAGDLDWIAARALAKDPDERYASVSELAADLRRHLADEPVLAGPPSTLYRLRRFARRHRREVGVGMLGLAGLLVALVYISFQAARLSRELDSFDVLARELEVTGLQRRAQGELWPAQPSRVPDMVAWRADMQRVLDDVPTFERLRDDVRRRGGQLAESGWSFASPREAYLHEHITALLASIDALRSPGGLIDQVVERQAWASELPRLTLEAPADRWAQALASIADREACPAYDGLVIEPQLGLVPLGRDPESRLWEFAFPQPGERLPERVDGRWKVADDTCLVFVLIPAGSFLQGAEGITKLESGGKRVELSPFLLSKYEMTQGQWSRVTGSNPSRYDPKRGATSLAHPVEQTDWLACRDALSRLGLALPTGAQWEYAARSGNPSPWWTGPAVEPPPECGNLADARLLAGLGPSMGITEFDRSYDDGWGVHAPVDAFRPNAFGLHNVIGNVREWCQDRVYFYSEAEPRPGDGLQVPYELDESQITRELRGGSFLSTFEGSRSTFRNQQPEHGATMVTGLRPARPLSVSNPNGDRS